MTKPMTSETPYSITEFAEKHGLSERQATMILRGGRGQRSRHMCDASAKALLAAKAARAGSDRGGPARPPS